MRDSDLEVLLVKQDQARGSISLIHGILLNSVKPSSGTLRGIWVKNLDQPISEEDWCNICKNLFPKCTSSGVHELNFKFMNRIYFTPVRLQKMFPDRSNLCFKSKTEKGVFFMPTIYVTKRTNSGNFGPPCGLL